MTSTIAERALHELATGGRDEVAYWATAPHAHLSALEGHTTPGAYLTDNKERLASACWQVALVADELSDREVASRAAIALMAASSDRASAVADRVATAVRNLDAAISAQLPCSLVPAPRAAYMTEAEEAARTWPPTPLDGFARSDFDQLCRQVAQGQIDPTNEIIAERLFMAAVLVILLGT